MKTEAARPNLAGVAELAELLSVRRTTISQWHSRQESNGFPDPVADLAMGPVWDQDAVVEWYRGYRPLRNMPKVGHLPDYLVEAEPEVEGSYVGDAGQERFAKGGYLPTSVIAGG